MQSCETGVCVIIAAANAEATVGCAVRTALTQDHVREVIVVDDASRDKTASAARLEDDGSGRLSVITLERNVGPAAARNIALDRSQSPFFCVLDADDYLLPGRMARLFGGGIGDWDMLADDIIIVPEGKNPDSSMVSCIGVPTSWGTLDQESFVLGNISRPGRPRAELGFLKPIVSREFLRRHGLRYDERLRLGEDYALYVRALVAGARFRIVSACGYIAVERKASISGRHFAVDLRRIAEFDEEVLRDATNLTRQERAALQAHLRATRSKYDYHRVLDRKRDSGVVAALFLLASVPSSFGHIFAQTIRARMQKWPIKPFAGAATHGQEQPRYLIGLAASQANLPSADRIVAKCASRQLDR